MSDEFSKRTVSQGRIAFRLRQTKLLVWIMHWVHDQDHCYRVASIQDIADAEEFKQLLDTSIQRAALRKVEDDHVNTISKAADPGKFRDKRKWPDWEPAFVNYLSTIPGSYHIPLSYVVRENEDPAHDRNFDEDFQAEMITCAPLHGAHFRADAQCVHQLLKTFLISETAEQWIKGLEHLGDGRRDMIALHNHYGGEGNASHRITIAERMRDNLHYRSECTLSFSIFLDRMQHMFNIYEEEDEPLTEKAKVRELFKRVQHRDLQETIKALKVRFDLEGLTYTQAANHITAAVSELPEYNLSRKISATCIHGGYNIPVRKPKHNGVLKSGIRGADRKIYTGFMKHWWDLSEVEKDQVTEERARLKKHQKNKKNKNNDKNNNHHIEEVEVLQDEITEMKHTILELIVKKKGKDEQGDDDRPPKQDAGNVFGGHREKAKKD